MNWLWKLLASLVVWVIVALIVGFVGTLLDTVGQPQIDALGVFLKNNAGLIGFLAGAAYFVWGKLPGRPAVQ